MYSFSQALPEARVSQQGGGDVDDATCPYSNIGNIGGMVGDRARHGNDVYNPLQDRCRDRGCKPGIENKAVWLPQSIRAKGESNGQMPSLLEDMGLD